MDLGKRGGLHSGRSDKENTANGGILTLSIFQSSYEPEIGIAKDVGN